MKVLLISGVLVGPLFTVLWALGGLLATGYDPMRHPISAIAIGDIGWIQVVNFLVSGTLLLSFAAGLRLLRPSISVWGPVLIGLAGIGLIGAGIFPVDPVNGFPPGAPLVPTERSTVGVLHDLFAAPFLFGLPISCLVFARSFGKRGQRGWVVFSLASGLTTFVVLLLAKMVPDPLATLGLFQRIPILVTFVWLTLLAIHVVRDQRQASAVSIRPS